MNKHIMTGFRPCNHTPVTALWWAALHPQGSYAPETYVIRPSRQAHSASSPYKAGETGRAMG